MVIVSVTVCGEPVIVTVKVGKCTVEVTVTVDVAGAGGKGAIAAWPPTDVKAEAPTFEPATIVKDAGP